MVIRDRSNFQDFDLINIADRDNFKKNYHHPQESTLGQTKTWRIAVFEERCEGERKAT
jgi:hypothetical protein